MIFPEFIFIKDIEVPKMVGTVDISIGDSPLKSFQEDLERCMLALATFKDGGAVGYDGIWVAPTEFTLGTAFAVQYVFGNDHVPLSHYALSPDEAPQIEAFAKSFEGIHPSLEMACQRLVDSARRTKARDALVDAVIGLESILLANLGDRTELRFRFSLNYACLFQKEQREEAFYIARSLYDLRSTIAHGGSPGEPIKLHGKEVSLGEAATVARSVLRTTIATFMPSAKSPEFMQVGFWARKALRL